MCIIWNYLQHIESTDVFYYLPNNVNNKIYILRLSYVINYPDEYGIFGVHGNDIHEWTVSLINPPLYNNGDAKINPRSLNGIQHEFHQTPLLLKRWSTNLLIFWAHKTLQCYGDGSYHILPIWWANHVEDQPTCINAMCDSSVHFLPAMYVGHQCNWASLSVYPFSRLFHHSLHSNYSGCWGPPTLCCLFSQHFCKQCIPCLFFIFLDNR